MDVLMIGAKSSFLQAAVDKFDKEGHRVFLLTEKAKGAEKVHKIFESYHFPYDSSCIKDVFASVKPDLVFYFGAYDVNFNWTSSQKTAVDFTSGLMNVLMSFGELQGGKFFYLSSDEVFQGDYSYPVEADEPVLTYSHKAQAVAMGEQMCQNYNQLYHGHIKIVRLEHLYCIPKDAADAHSYLARMIMDALDSREIMVEKNRRVSPVYISDGVEYLYQLAILDKYEHDIYQIASDTLVEERVLAEIICDSLKEEVAIMEVTDLRKPQTALSTHTLEDEFVLRIVNNPGKILPQMAAYMEKNKEKFTRLDYQPRTLWERFKLAVRNYLHAIIPFVENFICFIPFFMLNNRTVGSQYFQHLDFYLLYVLLFAILYGQQQAIFSSLLAICGYCFRQMYYRSGFDVMLDYNTYVWLAQLLILGLVIGYMRDQLRAQKEDEEYEIDYLSRQLDDITDINVSNMRVKEMLSDQLINQNDSLGKIYEITSSLNYYQTEEVLFYAAEVVAKLMRCKDVAIYTVANHSYARLFSSTSEQARALGNSIEYTAMEEVYEKLAKHQVYINRNMDERYPLMANAIYSEDEMQLIIMVWGLSWERMTLGQADMLTIIGYLIQNSVIHANRYIEALEHERYIPDTKIMEANAFITLVNSFLKAKTRELTQCTLVRIDEEQMELSRQEAANRILGMVRQSDYMGLSSDDRLFVLLANTSAEDAEFVLERFRQASIPCEIEEEVIG